MTPNAQHPAYALWRRHSRLGAYPDGCLAVPSPIAWTAFFPGGFGLWNPSPSESLPPWPRGRVMVLGHDFHSEVGYREALLRGHEDPSNPTWREPVKMLTAAQIPLTSCFFTNFYMGLRRGTATTGKFPGSRDASFVATCRLFLQGQLDAQ